MVKRNIRQIIGVVMAAVFLATIAGSAGASAASGSISEAQKRKTQLENDLNDAQALIEQLQNQEGDILEHLIEKHGIEGFLQIENQVNRDINVKKTVISTGGSVCYCDEALKHMSEHGVIVYIKTDYESLHQRLGDLHQRGVVIRNGSTLLDLYNERTPLYEKYADVVADVSGCRIEKAIDKIKNLLKACAKLYEE